MGDAPFFGYSSKRGYQNARKKHHSPSIITFIQDLDLHNSTVAQIVAKMWHNARPRKVGALTWLTLNNGLPVGTWLQTMGIQAPCKGYDQGFQEFARHCLMECISAQKAWSAFLSVWGEWEVPNRLSITWPFVLLGSPCSKKRTTPRTSISTTRVASPTGDNPSTFLGAFCSIIFGLKDAKGTLTASTPSKGFCSNLGKLRRRWAWPPGRPLDLLARIGLRTIRIALSLPLKLNGFTATSLGRARLPFRGAYSPPCTFSIFLMIDGAVASLPVRGSPCDAPPRLHPNGSFSRDSQVGVPRLWELITPDSQL